MDLQTQNKRAPIIYVIVSWNDNIGIIKTKTFMSQILENSNDKADPMIF